MFTPKSLHLLAAAILGSLLFVGCEKSLDSPEYGELIQKIPPKLDRPFPLPELNQPSPSPLAGPAEAPTSPAPPDAVPDQDETQGEESHK